MRTIAGSAALLLLQTLAFAELPTPEKNDKAPVTIKHWSRGNGWYQADSDHFRVVYTERDLAEKVIQVAERTQKTVLKKWFAEGDAAQWPCKCDIYLHLNADAYSRATGVPGTSPGHSNIGDEPADASRITKLEIHLHIDQPTMVDAVLPHEVTHITIAGRFGKRHIPRWADEGMAVLSEPKDKIEQHFRILPKLYEDEKAYGAGDLMKLAGYPPTGDRIPAFYAQGTALVKFLSERKSPKVFTSFLRDAQKDGYLTALKRHYEFSDFAELDTAWRKETVRKESDEQ